MFLIFIALTFISTFIGGLVSFRYKDKLHLILGFSAGVLLSVVAFDILPEIIKIINETGVNPIVPMLALVIGFLIFHILEKTLLIHHSHEETYKAHEHLNLGVLSASALLGHSFLDGVGIGLGFKVSTELGILVALAVITHDFTDGLNTVSLLLTHKNSIRKALIFLGMGAAAPLLGGISTLFFTVPTSFMVIYLGFFAGFLLYISTSDILPEAHSQSSSLRTIFMTILGVFITLVISLRLQG